MINASLNNKKVITSSLDTILSEISPEQRNELESLLNNLKDEHEPLLKSIQSNLEKKPYLNPPPENIDKNKKLEGFEMIFYEYGVFLGIVLGRSKAKDVVKMMQNYSDCLIINERIKKFSALYFYRDLDIAFCFDEDDTVKEITLGKKFKGLTSKGLKIHDNIARAIELYGKPKDMHANTISSYTWDNFLIFTEEEIITHIRFN
jgi:hypothetical protein